VPGEIAQAGSTASEVTGERRTTVLARGRVVCAAGAASIWTPERTRELGAPRRERMAALHVDDAR
jgi:hypothetical protein